MNRGAFLIPTASRTLAPRLLGGALGLALVLVSACVTTGSPGEGSRSSSDTEELKRRVIELQQQARMTRLEIARLHEKVAELEARLGISRAGRQDEGSTPSTRPPTQPPTRPSARQPAQRPVQRPTPSPPLDTSRAEPPLLEEIDLEPEPPSRPAPSARPVEPPEPSVETDPETTSPVTSPVTPAAQQLYDEGYTLYHRGRYLDAESTFQRFLQTHGNSDLADNARYWIGESRYARGDLPGALAAFRETVERHPQGNKVPDALLKAGQALEALGDSEGARETYREVVRRFGDSPAAAVARDRLEQIP